MLRNAPATLATTILLALAVLLSLPHGAHAASYWISLASSRGEIAPGVNSFTLHASGGPWSQNGSHCQAEPGSYVAGAYCKLRFNVPAGLSAGAVGSGGIARGQFRTSNAFAQLRSERPGGSPAGVTDSDGDGAFNHGWQVLGSYVEVGLRFTSATTTTGVTNWYHIDSLDVLLHDPTAPVIQHVQAGSGGWNGPGCIAHSYGWADSGSQVYAMQVSNLTTNEQVDSWAVSTTGPTSGYPTATDTGCTPAPGTGTYRYRTTAWDRSGNAASHDYALSFDTTLPTLDAPTLDGMPLGDRAVVDSRHRYRPAIRWGGIGDAHSGIRSVSATIAGQGVPVTLAGSVATLAPTAALTLGTHVLRMQVVDAVGNVRVDERTIIVRDDVAPTIIVASPDPTGGSEPVLDVSATDDHAGLDATSWTVRVNGATLVASSSTHRLQANIGYLIDGTHEIVVTVADRAGNLATSKIAYEADSGDGLPDAPGLDGVFVLDAPTRVEEGTTHHVRAIIVRAGRPVSGRAELRRGPLLLATGDIAQNGSVDIALTIDVPGPLTLHAPAESGLEPAQVAYEFVARAPAPPVHVPDPTPAPTPPTSTTNNFITNVAAPAAAPESAGGGAATPGSADSRGSYPRDVVYYVNGVPHWNGLPLAESGAPLDRVAPTWRLTLAQQPAGTVRRTRRIVARLWTSEMSVLNLQPTGSTRRTTVNPRRTWRTVHLLVGARTPLGRRLAAAKRGSFVTVRLRVVATDKNENRSPWKTVTWRVRV